MSLKSVIVIHPAVTIQASHSVNAPITASFHILPDSLFTNPITRRFKTWDTDHLYSLVYDPAHHDSPYRPVFCFFCLLTPFDFRHSPYTLTTLILVFLLFFFHLVSTEILPLRSYRRTFLPDNQGFLVFLILYLLLQYLAFFTWPAIYH
jgi:hypothetical protein